MCVYWACLGACVGLGWVPGPNCGQCIEVWTGFLICTLMGRTNIYVQYSTQYGEIPPAQHLIENSNHVSHQTLDQKNYSEC